MKKSNILLKVFFAGLAVFTFVFSLAGCKNKPLTDTPLENMQTIADFTNGKQKSFFPSDGWCNGEPFNVTWSGENIKYQEGAAKLIITETDEKFYGGELRSSDHYWYGDYEITIKPDPKKGTCSSFFVYTGPSETDENGNPNPHDEIDIEFLGKDTTHVQFNFFVDGKGGNEYKYDLGFDASEEYHTYGFRWTESYITWYVDGKPVYRVDETDKKTLPKTPGRMMMNYWCGTKEAELWMGKYSHPEANEGSYYKIVKTSAKPIVAESATSDIDWSKVNPLTDLTALGDDKHVITANGSSYNVVYTNNVGASYTNVKFELEDKAKDMNYLYLRATNNATSSANIRVDVFGDATRKTENNKNVCNIAATMDGQEVSTDLNWGGSSFNNIPAGETVEIVIYYEGVANSIQIMFDTHIYGDTSTHSGNVTISDIKFAKYGELNLPNKDEEDDTNEVPTININNVDKSFDGNLDTYQLEALDNKLTAVYQNVLGNSYHNINTQVNDIASNMNHVTLKITNNGNSLTRVRIDVDSTTKVNETTACNVFATMNGTEVWTDTTWGGTMFEIAPQATVTCVIKFDNSRGVKQLMFYIDSAKYDDNETHTGSITISDINFELIKENTDDDQGEEPVIPTPNESVALEFTTAAGYVITNDNASKTTTVVYEGIMDSTWQCISAGITNVVGDNNKVEMTFKNHGTETVTFRLDVGYESNGALVSQIISASAGTYNSGEKNVSFEVATGQELTITVVFDTTTPITGINVFIDSSVWKEEGNRLSHSGNIAISNVVFTKEENQGESDTPIQSTAVKINDVNKVFEGNLESYQVTYTENSLNVIYENLSGSSYHNINTQITDIASNKNQVTLTITNNGSTQIKVRVDVNSNTKVNNTNACNTKATMNGSDVWTDTEWGGSIFDIASGATVTCVVDFDNTRDVTNLMFFIDSSYGDGSTNSGNVIISDINFN